MQLSFRWTMSVRDSRFSLYNIILAQLPIIEKKKKKTIRAVTFSAIQEVLSQALGFNFWFLPTIR